MILALLLIVICFGCGIAMMGWGYPIVMAIGFLGWLIAYKIHEWYDEKQSRKWSRIERMERERDRELEIDAWEEKWGRVHPSRQNQNR